MLAKIYKFFHRLFCKPDERNKYSAGYWQDKIRREALRLCRGLKGRLLEVGCGEGLFLKQLAQENPGLEIWGVDNNSQRLSEAKDNFPGGFPPNINLSFQNASELQFEGNYFDAVVCINVFFNMESLNKVRQALTGIKRVSKNSAKLIFDFRNSSSPLLSIKYRLARYYDKSVKNLPLRCYSYEEIKSILLGLKFKVNRKIPIGFSFFKDSAPIILIEAETL